MDEELSKALRLLRQAGRDPFLVCKKTGSGALENSTYYIDLRQVIVIQHDIASEGMGVSDPLNVQFLFNSQWVWGRVPPTEVKDLIERWQALRLGG